MVNTFASSTQPTLADIRADVKTWTSKDVMAFTYAIDDELRFRLYKKPVPTAPEVKIL